MRSTRCVFLSIRIRPSRGIPKEPAVFLRGYRNRSIWPTVVEAIKKIYSKYDQQTAFEYQFMDDAFNEQYKARDRLAALFDLFTTITIIIACLGLFALATFTAEQRHP